MRVHWSHVSVDFEGQARMMEFFEQHPRVGDFTSTSFHSDARRYMNNIDGDKGAGFEVPQRPLALLVLWGSCHRKVLFCYTRQSDPTHSRR